MKLTNTAIDALPLGAIVRDDLIPGLHVKASKKAKSFYLYFRTKAGVERRPKLGDYGIISIAQARDIAREMLAAVAYGGDPMADRAKVKAEPTMDALWAHMEKEHYNQGRQWDREAKRLYHAHVKPRFGGHRVRDIRYEDVDGLRVALKSSRVQANAAVAVVSNMLNMAERFGWRDLGTNPCRLVPRYPTVKRRRYAKPDEIAAIGPLLEAEAEANPAAVAFIYLLMFSGARPSEIANARWDQVEKVERDGQTVGVLRLHGKTTGATGEIRDVFLPPQAMSVLNRLPKTGTTITGLAGVPRKVWCRVREKAGCTDLWARDWRRTWATVGFSGGEDKHIVSNLLGHASMQTTNIYARLMEDPAHAAAFRIANRMEGLLKG